MATFEIPEFPMPRMSPHVMVGAASPLWPYFGAVTAGGVAWWLMTRWTRPANLEVLFGRAFDALPEMGAALAAPVADAVDVVVAQAEAAAPDLASEPLGGEAAPISPLVEALTAPSEPVSAEIGGSSESGAATPEEAEGARPRGRKAPIPNGSDAQP